ncbi:MAG TPA: hypothetical protein VLD18_15505 [Verrucomicrobiae bacterium]|nr:hypothetical protein [Verrucomicrobiae bacterium]
MNTAHLHLVFNHFPVIGTLFGLALLAWGHWRKSEELKRVSLGALVIVTLLSIPAYLTGEPAEDAVENLPGVTHHVIEEHEEAAQVAFTAQILLGAGALAGLLVFRRQRTVPAWFGGSATLLALIVFLLMARTANLGGEVRHTEIRSGPRSQSHDD